jgi:hypothetical protein
MLCHLAVQMTPSTSSISASAVSRISTDSSSSGSYTCIVFAIPSMMICGSFGVAISTVEIAPCFVVGMPIAA